MTDNNDLASCDSAELWDRILLLVRELQARGDEPFAEYQELWGKSGGITQRSGKWTGGGDREPEPANPEPRSGVESLTLGGVARLEALTGKRLLGRD